MVENNSYQFRCNICNKNYKDKSGLWYHNNKYHGNNNSKIRKISKINENLTENNKYKCKNCKILFETLNDLDIHVKTKCVPCISHNNVFTFKIDTFGKNKYSKENGGDIYIVQTEFNLKNYYKIGVTTNLYSRMSDYRCGAVLEPRIHCYFPVKNIKEADKILKQKLQKFNVKREIYKCENLSEIKQLIKQLQKEFKSEELEVIPEIKECNICECEYCKEIFTNKYELNIHLNTCEYIPINEDKIDGYCCEYCGTTYLHRQSKYKHQCKNKSVDKDEEKKIEQKEIINLLIEQIKEQKEKIEEQEQQNKEIKKTLMELLNKNCKVHPKTLQKINRQLNGDHNTINETINNGTVNNTYNIIALGASFNEVKSLMA